MTRGKWVALAVGLAVIAVLVLNGPAMWMAVAYEEERQEAINPDGLYPIVLISGGEYAPLDFEYMLIMRKRIDWLPGPDRHVRCAWCVESDHGKCHGSKLLAIRVDMPIPVPSAIDLSRCDCPHPSHAQESE